MFGAGTVQWAWGLDSDQTRPATRRPRHAAGDGQPVRRHGRAAGHADRPGSSRRRASTDTTAPTSTITSPSPAPRRRRHAGHRSPARRRTPAAASSPASRSRPTAARPGTRRRGTHELDATRWIAHGSPTPTIQSRAIDDSGNIETPAAGVDGQRDLPVLDLGHERDARRPSTPATPARSRSASSSRPTSRHRSPASASTRPATTPAPTSGTCGRRPAHAARAGDVHRRDRLRLADRHVRDAGRDPRRARRTSRRTSRPAGTTRPQRLLLPHPPRPERRRHRRQPAAARAAQRTRRPATNGVFRYGGTSTFPTQLFGASNYWVDVIFTPIAGARPGHRT